MTYGVSSPDSFGLFIDLKNQERTVTAVRYTSIPFTADVTLGASPKALWELVGDTNAFNYHTKRLGTIQRVRETPDGPLLRTRKLGIVIEWIERPFRWTYPHGFSFERHYTRGPLALVRGSLTLEPTADGGTTLTYHLDVTPRNLLGRLIAPREFREFVTCAKGVFASYDAIARRLCPFPALQQTSTLSAAAHARLQGARKQLLMQNFSSEFVDRFLRYLAEADAMSLGRIRPYALARYWSVDHMLLLRLCMAATRAGALDLRVEVRCTLCRGVKAAEGTAGELPRAKLFCESCHVEFTDQHLGENTEITFRPNPNVRDTAVGEFCVGGPGLTAHILFQQLTEAGKSATITLSNLEPDTYRVRLKGKGGGSTVAIAETGAQTTLMSASVICEGAAIVTLAPSARVVLQNNLDTNACFQFERLAWQDDAVSPADIYTLPEYRDLFSQGMLRQKEQIGVWNLAVVFTDLKGSTRFWEDRQADAIGPIFDHFDLIKRCLRKHGGTWIKGIGDAVMAYFRKPLSAILAMIEAQEQLAHPPAGKEAFKLKAGINSGRCFVANDGTGDDVYGPLVNRSSRLESFSSAKDIVITDEVYTDPEVAEWLRNPATEWRAELIGREIKGVDGEVFALWRLVRR